MKSRATRPYYQKQVSSDLDTTPCKSVSLSNRRFLNREKHLFSWASSTIVRDVFTEMSSIALFWRIMRTSTVQINRYRFAQLNVSKIPSTVQAKSNSQCGIRQKVITSFFSMSWQSWCSASDKALSAMIYEQRFLRSLVPEAWLSNAIWNSYLNK